jgi:hypothetical protein
VKDLDKISAFVRAARAAFGSMVSPV